MIRVGVLRGGTNDNYQSSLASGAHVLQNLPRDRYELLDVYIDTSGVWHLGGVPVSHDKLRHRVDVIWNSLHGFYGEDGKLQQLFETLSIPYTGSGPLTSAISMNKKLTKDRLSALGVKTPRGIYIEDWGTDDKEATVMNVVRAVSAKFSPPWIVEPIYLGHSTGPITASTREALAEVLSVVFDSATPVLIEEAVLGTSVSVISVSGFRGQPVYSFIPRIIGEISAKLHSKEKEVLQSLARVVHEGLHVGAYSRMTAVLDKRGNVSVVGLETMPRTEAEAELHDALEEVGASFHEFAHHLLNLALGKK